MRRIVESLSVVIMLALFAAQIIIGIAGRSAVFDEPPHVVAGYSYLRTGSFRLNPEHPPLTKYFSALPLISSPLQDPRLLPSWDTNDAFRAGDEFLYRSGYDADAILFKSRMATVAFSLALGLLIYAWVRSAVSVLAALIALLLYTFTPTVIAFSGWVLPDIGATFFQVAVCYGAWRYLRHPGLAMRVFLGVLGGLALLAKFNSLIVIPVIVWVLLIGVRAGVKPFSRSMPVVITGTALVAAFTVWAGYAFETGPLTAKGAAHRTAERLLSGFPDQAQRWVTRFAESVPVPAPSFWRGVAWVVLPMTVGREVYYNGHVMDRAPWFGNLAALVVKSPLPLIFLFSIYLYLVIAGPRLRDSFSAISVLYLLILMATSVAFRFGLSVKYMLPAYPFLAMLSARAFVWLWRYSNSSRLLASLLILWHCAGAVLVSPDYMAYANEFSGGPDRLYLSLVDSNLDWGQDLPAIKKFMEKEKIDTISLAYFGTADPGYYGIKYTRLAPFERRAGWIAVSVTFLQGLHVPSGAYNWLFAYQPQAILGRTVYVYHVDQAAGDTSFGESRTKR